MPNTLITKDNKEIERSWVLPKELISVVREKSSHCIPHLISYLFSNNFGEMRVVKRWTESGIKYSITVKNRGDLVRDEWEDDNFPEWAHTILSSQCASEIRKDRYFIKHKKYLLEIDEYQSRGFNYFLKGTKLKQMLSDVQGKLRLECEFPSEIEAKRFFLPDWLKDAKEITNDPRFKNSEITKNGWPKDK